MTKVSFGGRSTYEGSIDVSDIESSDEESDDVPRYG